MEVLNELRKEKEEKIEALEAVRIEKEEKATALDAVRFEREWSWRLRRRIQAIQEHNQTLQAQLRLL